MRATVLWCGMLSVVLAGPAGAAGVDLAWGGCLGDPEAASLRMFACDKNGGDDVLFASFVPVADFPVIQILEVALDLRTRSGAELPSWWDFRQPNGCRREQLQPTLQVSSTETCEGWRPPPDFAINRFNFHFHTPDAAHLVVSTRGTGTGVLAGHHYIACKFSIRRAHTKDAVGGCSGCKEPVEISVSAVRIATLQAEQVLTQAQTNARALWQRNAVTATSTATWSAVKALYR